MVNSTTVSTSNRRKFETSQHVSKEPGDNHYQESLKGSSEPREEHQIPLPNKYAQLGDEARKFQTERSQSPEATSSSSTDTDGQSRAPTDEPRPPPAAGNEASIKTQPTSRIHQLSDQVVESLNKIAHQLNIYTGTDYSPIQFLRDSIKSQEAILRRHHGAVGAAKSAHASALDIQRTHQKEVVQLLERKHSWSDGDMERYMGLIRSEHVNERAVENAHRDVIYSERALEEARQELERCERKMYHEEQVWSDTIRRNSTWITFGLMGFNVFLLLGQIVFVEPWRRKRLIREMRGALDEKVTPSSTTSVKVLDEQDQVEAEKDQPLPLDADLRTELPVEATTSRMDSASPDTVVDDTGEDENFGLSTRPSNAGFNELPPGPLSSPGAFVRIESWQGILVRMRILFEDLFSMRTVSMRKADLTSARLESASLGVMIGGFAVLLGVALVDE